MGNQRTDHRSGAPKTLVTGGTGAVGSALVETLVRRGHRVRVLTWRAAPDGAFDEVVVGDIADQAAVARAVAGVEQVFHLAALLHVNHPSPALRGEYERVNVDGTRTVVEAARRAGVRRVVLFSTCSVYGPTPGTIADESTPPRPQTPYAATKLRAEEVALKARIRDSGEPLTCVLRLAAVYGPRMKGNYRRLARALARGWFVPVGHGANRRTLVFEQDVVAAALLAAEHPAAPGRVFNVTDGCVHRLRDILAAAGSAMGRRPPPWTVPLPAARAAAAAADAAIWALGNGRGAARAALEKYVEDVAVSGALIQHELGFGPKYDLTAGWRETVDAMRRSGAL